MVKSVMLPLAPQAAFELFTKKIGEWWPADRRHTEDPASEIFLLQSGRFHIRNVPGSGLTVSVVLPSDPATGQG